MNRYVILIAFDDHDIRLAEGDEDDGRARIFNSEDEARDLAGGAIWRKLPWWIIPVDEMEEN